MASEADVSEISSLFERLVRNRDMSLFLPFVFGLSDSSSPTENGEDETGPGESTDGPSRERIILVNPFTQGMVVIDGASSLEALFREIGINHNNGKCGQPPASKESIEAMPRVEIRQGEEHVGECVVCLEEFRVGVLVKEMPCKHRFHETCIDKWLGIHGSCPVCRYEMPVEGKKSEEEEEEGGVGGERRRRNGEVWVSFSFNRGGSRRSHDHEDSNHAPSSGDDGSSDDSTSTPTGGAAEVDS